MNDKKRGKKNTPEQSGANRASELGNKPPHMDDDDGSEQDGDRQSVAKALKILRIIAKNPGASLQNIAQMAGIPGATVQRHVAALEREGFVAKGRGRRGVYAAMELVQIAKKVNAELEDRLSRLVSALQTKTGESVDATVLENGRAVVIAQCNSPERAPPFATIGARLPLHCTANGKAHLAQLSQKDAVELLGDRLHSYTKNTMTNIDDLLRHIEERRERMFYCDESEFGDGVSGVAVPLDSLDRRHFAVAIIGERKNIQRKQKAIRKALLEVAIATKPEAKSR